MPRWATTAEIARQAGVSRATVDRVINGRAGVHPRTVKLVTEISQAMRSGNQKRPAATKSAPRFQLAFVLPTNANSFLQSLADEVPALMEDDWTYNLVRSASFQAADVVAALNCVPESVAGLVVVAPDVPVVQEALRRFREAGKPIIALASPFVGADAYVGTNNRAAGRIAAQLISRFVRLEGGTVGLMRGLLSYRGQEEREMGFRAVLDQEAPGLKVAVLERSQSKDDSAERQVLDAVSHLPTLCGIYSMAGNNSEIAAALVAAGRTDIVLIGHDLTPGTRASLLSGVMDAAIVQSPIDEIRQATKTLTAMVRDPTFRSMPPLEHLPIHIVIRESLS